MTGEFNYMHAGPEEVTPCNQIRPACMSELRPNQYGWEEGAGHSINMLLESEERVCLGQMCSAVVRLVLPLYPSSN